MGTRAKREATRLLRWRDVYREAELYKAAVRIYTKPVFQWRKALGTSTDGKTLYDFAARGLARLDAIHGSLWQEDFQFRPAVALHYDFNGKHRTLYIPPWEERIVDLLLYRTLNRKLHSWFSANSYAYRDRKLSLDTCQTRIASALRSVESPLYAVKRDIRDFFASINHELLLEKLAALCDCGDYLYRLLAQRVRFAYQENGNLQIAEKGIPFGTSIACLFANIYLTEMDREFESFPEVRYFRYADDLLLLSTSREAAMQAAEQAETHLASLKLQTKASHQVDLCLADKSISSGAEAPRFEVGNIGAKAPIPKSTDCERASCNLMFSTASSFRHLGLLFCKDGRVALSQDKLHKVQNLFRFAFRRKGRWKREKEPRGRAQQLINITGDAIEKGVRNVAILDYYLKHVNDVKQLRLLDRWLAEEVLSRVFGGHKKGHFRRISFAQLRAMGLPSLLHRRRMILNGKIESSFFIWQREKSSRAFRGTVARLCRSTGETAFSSFPEAAANKSP